MITLWLVFNGWTVCFSIRYILKVEDFIGVPPEIFQANLLYSQVRKYLNSDHSGFEIKQSSLDFKLQFMGLNTDIALII